MATAHERYAGRFAKARIKSAAAAASLAGVAAGETPTSEQLAHMAWHIAAIEPSELRDIDVASESASNWPPCLETHLPGSDALDESLPLPHPLDYEWRYEIHTRALLAERCRQIADNSGLIALLGTPTLAPQFSTYGSGVLLIESNAALLAALSDAHLLGRVECEAEDLSTFIPPRRWSHRASVVVCDPPWYPETIVLFLRTAAQLVRPGGTVLLSVPDVLTRPSVARELHDLRGIARGLQLALVESTRQILRYRTPFFEFRALRAAGLSVIPLNWRAGTLWEFTSIGIAREAFTTGRKTPSASSSINVTIQGVRFRVTPTRPGRLGALSLQSVIPGDTLPTVSSRHPARSAANLWTSGNSVLLCEGTELASTLLREFGGDGIGTWGADRDRLTWDFASRHSLPVLDVVRALDKIRSIIEAEHRDYEAYRTAGA